MFSLNIYVIQYTFQVSKITKCLSSFSFLIGPNTCTYVLEHTWFVRMYIPLGVLMTRTVSPAGILFRPPPPPPPLDCVAVLVPGITMSENKTWPHTLKPFFYGFSHCVYILCLKTKHVLGPFTLSINDWFGDQHQTFASYLINWLATHFGVTHFAC